MNKDLQRLKELDHEIQLLERSAALLGWDEETYMPPRAIDERAEQMALLSTLMHDRIVAPETGELLDRLGVSDENPKGDASLPELDRAFLRAIWRRHRRETRLPADLVKELSLAAAKGQAVWREARAKNDFAAFAPSLERLVALTRRKAECVGFTDHPYDALIDEYEPWMKTKDVRAIFTPLAAELSDLAGRIAASPQVDDGFLNRTFARDKQELFGREVLRDIGYDLDRGRLDVSTHPFTTTLGFHDVRITARYDESFFPTGISSIIHEMGHALYELGFPASMQGSILANGTSLGIHESQSRTWENVIGKSRAFWVRYLPRLKELFPSELRDVTVDQFYRAMNTVHPSLIRIEADEVTYGLHIVLRFELETSLVTGDLAVKDAPAAWNDAMKRLLGITPDTDANGVLQDIHWSMGGMGYFPTYALGNLYGAQFVAAMRKSGIDPDAAVEAGRFDQVLGWLRSNIHLHGAAMTAEEICRTVTGEPLNPSHFVAYLKKKFAPIYGL